MRRTITKLRQKPRSGNDDDSNKNDQDANGSTLSIWKRTKAKTVRNDGDSQSSVSSVFGGNNNNNNNNQTSGTSWLSNGLLNYNNINGSGRDDDRFFIELDEPHRQFHPGDVIKGKVTLILPKKTLVEKVTCGLHGAINIKNPLVKGKTARHVLFNDELDLWSIKDDDDDLYDEEEEEEEEEVEPQMLPRGQHIFCFEFQLPSDGVVTSIEFERGSISYHISARCVIRKQQSAGPKPKLKPIAFKRQASNQSATTLSSPTPTGSPSTSTDLMHTQQTLKVLCPENVALLPPPKPTCLSVEVRRKRNRNNSVSSNSNTPDLASSQASISSSQASDMTAQPPTSSASPAPSSSITTFMEIRQRGFLRGESIPVKVVVNHIRPTRSMSGCIVTLSRISRVTSAGLEPQTFRKDIAQVVSPLYTHPDSLQAEINTSVRIPPDTFPTTKGLDVVSFQYYIEAVVDLAGTFSAKQVEHDESKFGMVDTDKLTSKRGFVNLWTDVIVGTIREASDPPSSPSQDNETATADGVNEEVLASTRVSPELFTNQLPADAAPSYEEHHSEYNNHQPNEKELMRRFEETLLPSQPPEQSTSSPCAPESSLMMSQSPVAPRLPRTSDKAEIEQRRLEELASHPNGQQDEFVPAYQPTAPSASSAPIGLCTNGFDNTPSAPPGDDNEQQEGAQGAQGEEDDDEEAPSAPPMPPS